MCRSGLEANGNGEARRCDCDTSAARRLRRHNATAIKQFAEETIPLLGHSSAEQIVEVVDVEKLTLENIKLIMNDINNLRSALNRGYGDPTSFITMADGTEHEITSRTRLPEIEALIEKETVKLGDTINQLVEHRTGITDAAIAEADAIELAALTENYSKRLKMKEELNAEKAEKWPDQTTGGLVVSSNLVLSRAYQAGDEEAITYRKTCEKFNEESSAEYGRLNLAQQGYSEKSLKLAEIKREELIKVLEEIRPLGGSIVVAENSAKPAVKTLREVEKVYPSDWVAASNMENPPRVKKTTSRAHYSNGAWQETFKLAPKRKMHIYDADWEPDTTNRAQGGEWIKIEADGEWKDPETGITYQASNVGRTEQTWIHTPLEYAYGRKDIDENLIKPKGTGWKIVKVVENKFDRRTMQEYEELVERYARPIRARVSLGANVQPELTISGTGKKAYSVGLHEFAHRIESSGRLGSYIERLEEAHIKRRTTDENGERQQLVQIYAKKKEYGRPDNFTDLYMGKEYKDGYREILSTGAESVFANSYVGLIGLGNHKADPEMKGFIIGLWASA